MGCNCGGGMSGSGSVMFTQSAHPIATYIQAIQRLVGAPASGMWDRASHTALDAFMSGTGASRLGAWGSNPTEVGRWIIQFLPDDPTEFTLLRPFLVDLGLPSSALTNLSAFQGWSRGLTEAELASFGTAMDAVKDYVVGVENGTVDPRKAFGDVALANQSSGGGSAILVVLAVAAVGVVLWSISGKKE